MTYHSNCPSHRSFPAPSPTVKTPSLADSYGKTASHSHLFGLNRAGSGMCFGCCRQLFAIITGAEAGGFDPWAKSIQGRICEQTCTGDGGAAVCGVDPVWWAPYDFAWKCSRCPRHIPPIRRNFGNRWLSWSVLRVGPGELEREFE
jgi:hypothetical protein